MGGKRFVRLPPAMRLTRRTPFRSKSLYARPEMFSSPPLPLHVARGHLRLLVALLLGAGLLAACRRPEAGGRAAARVALTPCRLRGVPMETLCGTYEVFEDRAARTGRKLRLNLAVVPALAAEPKPDPLFILAGGPGQAATEAAEAVMPALTRVRRQRDIVFLDQRGTGRSNPLDCNQTSPDASLAESLEPEPREELFRKCLAGYDADVRLYTTPIAMDDLDEVRDALGYPRVNLWGGSYGTRAALVYLRQHPDRVRTAILDGVAPLGRPLPLTVARDAQRSLDLTLDQCAADPACARAFPDLRERLQALLTRLDQQPVRTRLAHPVTGRVEEVELSRKTFTGLLRAPLYTSIMSSLTPLVLARAAEGDFAPLVAQGNAQSADLVEAMSWGMFYSVICAEDVPFASAEAAAQAAAGTIFGSSFADDLQRICGFWPRGTLPEGYHAPVESSAPVLVFSGELDPVTPPSNGEEVLQHLRRGKHVVVPGTGHNTLGQACVSRLVADFLDRGSTDGLDTSCVQSVRRPPFFVSFAGPPR